MLSRQLALILATVGLVAACGPSMDPQHPARAPLADKWLARARVSYKSGDFDDASVAGKSALQAAPNDPEIRTLNARIALAKLEIQFQPLFAS